MARYAAEHKAWPFGPPQKPELVGARQAWGYGVTTGLTILLVGVLAFTLIATGRRRLWLPVAFGGLCLGQASAVVMTYSDWGSWVGVAASLAVVAVAATPLLLATRGRLVEHRPILPAWPVTTVVVGVLLADWLWVKQYNGPVQPRPAPTLALLVAAAVLTASPLRRRWLPVLLVGAVLAVPQLQEPLGGLEASGWHEARISISQYQVGPLLFTVGVAVAGALIGAYGARALEVWRSVAGRGPELRLRRAENVAA